MRRIAPRNSYSSPCGNRSAQGVVRPGIAVVDSARNDAGPSDGWPSEWDDAEVTRCDSAHAALRLARSNAPDLWVINVQGGDLSGFDLCRMLKERRPKTPIFLVADEYSPNLEQAALAARATLFVCQPAHVDAIRQWIATQFKSPRVAHEQPSQPMPAH